jgi:DNA-binding LacI/PurR family transcriptional regulator
LCGPNVTATPDLPDLVRRLAKRRRGRLGLFVTRDEETVHVYPLLRQAGLEPGRDVVVVSCDNEAVRLSTLSPRPASIDLGSAEIARHAVRRLSTRMKLRNEPPVRILVNPHLVEGDPVMRG